MSEQPHPDFVIRVMVLLIVAIIAIPMLLTTGRGIMCAVRAFSVGPPGCPFEEYTFAVEQFSGYLATVIALLMALLNRKL